MPKFPIFRACSVLRSTRFPVIKQQPISTHFQIWQAMKREASETPGSAKRAKAEGSPSKKKEAVPVPDLEECGFATEELPQV